MYLATVLESKLRAEYGKEEAKKVILELYLNTVGFGKGCYGVQAASERYFGKDVKDLNLDECTVLGAIIQRPTALEPVANPENNNNRRKIILKYLKNADKITDEEYKASIDANPYVGVSEHNEKYVAENETNSYFADTLIEEITKDLVEQKGLTEEVATNLIYSGGLKIYSTMNKKVQDSIDAVFQGKDSAFATQGAEYTLTVEALMHNGVALQSGTSHYFGQKFSKAYDIKFADRNNGTSYVYQTSWGVSSRMIGALIMVHSDEDGLVLPPRIAPTQVRVIPIGKEEENADVYALADKLFKELNDKDVRVDTDLTEKSPGFKFAEAEVLGIPVRIEVGKRDLENGMITLVRRDTKEKIQLSKDCDIVSEVNKLLETIQNDMLQRATERRDSMTFEARTLEELENMGIKDGDTVRVYGWSFEYFK